MKQFPALVPQEFRLEGRGYLEAAADIKLSSAGKHLPPAPHLSPPVPDSRVCLAFMQAGLL